MSRSRSKSLRIVYAGTPDFAVPALQALIDSEHQVVAVYTQPDRPAGRGRKLQASPVKHCALAADIPVLQPVNFKEAGAVDALRALSPDVMVVAAYGLILPQHVLDKPEHGCQNIHASLLPRWRGAAPIQRAILAGDEQSGVTIMQMAAGLDTGDMLRRVMCPISEQDTGQSLHDRLATDGAGALLSVLAELDTGALNPVAQDDALANYAHKLSKDEAAIDWSKPALELGRMVRAFTPWPVAFTHFNGKPLRVLSATPVLNVFDDKSPVGTVFNENSIGIDVMTGDGVLRITRLQMPGGKAMDVSVFLNGNSLLNEVFPS